MLGTCEVRCANSAESSGALVTIGSIISLLDKATVLAGKIASRSVIASRLNLYLIHQCIQCTVVRVQNSFRIIA